MSETFGRIYTTDTMNVSRYPEQVIVSWGGNQVSLTHTSKHVCLGMLSIPTMTALYRR